MSQNKEVWSMASRCHDEAKRLGVLDEHAGAIATLVSAAETAPEVLSDKIKADFIKANEHLAKCRELRGWKSEVGSALAREELAAGVELAVRGFE